jgi:hypothetical protein
MRAKQGRMKVFGAFHRHGGLGSIRRGALLIGNLAEGQNNAYDPESGTFLGQLIENDENVMVPDAAISVAPCGHLLASLAQSSSAGCDRARTDATFGCFGRRTVSDRFAI